MPLLGSDSIRALAYVDALTSQGVHPTSEDINAFIDARSSIWDHNPNRWELDVVPVADYLLDARLLRPRVEGGDAVEMTPAGAALLRHEAPVTDSGVVEVVGRVSDPFTYAEILTQIDSIPDSLVIDPYLQARDLRVLLQLRQVKRVLIRSASAHRVTQAERDHQLRIAVGAGTDVQLRAAAGAPNELHDRVVLSRDGSQALLLGTSLGGTQLTVLTRVEGATASILREHYEPIWDGASTMEPIAKDAE